MTLLWNFYNFFILNNSFRYVFEYSNYSQLLWKWRERSSNTYSTTSRVAADSEGTELSVSSMCRPIDSSFGFFTVSFHILFDIVCFMYIWYFLGLMEFAGDVAIMFRLVVEHRRRRRQSRSVNIQWLFEKVHSSPDRIFRFGRFWCSWICGFRTCL